MRRRWLRPSFLSAAHTPWTRRFPGDRIPPSTSCFRASVTVIRDGSRFSRLQKVRDIAGWPTALEALRPCPAKPRVQANCGKCEKCLRTRLELLAAGVEETGAFGPSFTPIELWEDAAPSDVGDRGIFYQDLLPALRSRGFDSLCRVIEEKLTVYRRQEQRELVLA